MTPRSRTRSKETDIPPLEVAHRVIAANIREKIFSGSLAPGSELPSTVELAGLWKTSKSTMHTALCNLVKEGLLERHHGSCTFVRERPLSLDRVGVYYDSPQVWLDEERVFYRQLQAMLEKELAKEGIALSVFVDRRPEEKQRMVLPSLRRAIMIHEIQGLIIPLANSVNLPSLLRLNLPVSVMTDASGLPNKVTLDDRKYFGEVLSRLAAKGCRSVALISSVESDPNSSNSADNLFFADDFLREVKNHQMLTRSEWIITPQKYVTKKALFGYREFHKLWHQSTHPDAVIVYPDNVVRGVVMAALELGVHHTNEVTFCFHSNAHVDMLCPFPALWAISNEEKVADALIDLVRRQHAGKQVSPVRMGFEFQTSRRISQTLA